MKDYVLLVVLSGLGLAANSLPCYNGYQYFALAVLAIVDMERQKFEELVIKAVDGLPPEFQHKLENVDIVVENWPTRRQLRQAKHSHPAQLLGLYQGIPRTRRGEKYGLVLPDKITIFQGPIEGQCRSDDEIEAKVEEVVRHEIAHHFGLDEETLRKIESDKSSPR